MSRMFVAINRCPVHKDFWSVSVDDESGGTRITPGKCCGQWRVVKSWRLDPRELREAARVFEDAADTLETEMDASR